MPFSIKKQLKTIKRELSKIIPSTPLKSLKSSKHNETTDQNLPTFKNIRNDLKCNRYKDEKNAYRDYSKLCDKILLQQNNSALRCAQEKKISNLSRSELLVNAEGRNECKQKRNNLQAVENTNDCDNKINDNEGSE